MFLKMALYIPILYKIGKQIALINVLIGTYIYIACFFFNFKNLFYQFYVGTYMIYMAHIIGSVSWPKKKNF